MSIWFKPVELTSLSNLLPNTILERIGIEITEIGENSLSGKMPVDERTKQPMGLLHGGASVVLAESLGSLASVLVVDQSKFNVVGLEINANHVRPAFSGYVYGTASPIHIGKKTHLWDIKIINEEDKLVCISRLTIAVVGK